ncbi:hypothetical protein [Sphingomonas sp.]|uniref:hypothetical protein n=1 Tax=Sphingomonas sp. TaxID=28214 RepID=UPI002DD628B8|nr:hypothetical protein [Sphingomonas sp.]
MGDTLNWLDEVVVLNESRDENVPGDVSIYRSEGEAFSKIEDWWIENGEGFAFTATGVRLVLGVDGGVATVICREQCADGQAIVLNWLQALAQTTLAARNRAAQGQGAILSQAEEDGALPTSVEGLIGYIGFPWVAPRNRFMPGCTVLSALIALFAAVVLVKLL